MNTLIQICGGAAFLLIILFAAGVARGAIREQRRPARKPRLGREIRLNAWNYRAAYTACGVMTDVGERGQVYAYYQSETDREIAERNFPDAVILQMKPEDLRQFEHPNG